MTLEDTVLANIRHLMEGRGYTNGDLGWPRQFVWDVLHKRRNLTLRSIKEFAAALGCDPLDLFREPEK